MSSKGNRKGDKSMAATVTDKLFKNEVIGTKELRNNISKIIDHV